MNRNDLIKKLRHDFNYNMRKDLLQEKCEICDSSEGLEVHHFYTFFEMIEDALKLTNLTDITEFSDDEVKLLRYVILGMQVKECKYMTLCKKCHVEIHDYNYSQAYLFKRFGIIETHKKTHEKLLSGEIKIELNDEYLDTQLAIDDMRKICLELNIKDPEGNRIGYLKLIKMLKASGYKINKKRKNIPNNKKVTVYIITK